MNPFRNPIIALLVVAGLASFALASLEPGKLLKLTLHGIDPSEPEKMNGEYRPGEPDSIPQPLLEKPVPASSRAPLGPRTLVRLNGP